MALFQKTVEQKYLKQLNPEFISAKYLEFKDYFWNPDIQENIRNSKEEQFQEGFLRELFVKILGYTLNPTPNFNLTTEYKNIKDSKKADGAIIFNDSVKAVIELKGTNTTDLSKIEAQAFGYKNNQPDCVYVVTSNFEKLRFYIDNAIENIEFNLFTLTKADFEILYLCLSSESIKNGIPKKVKDESLSQEDTITKKLYHDYSLFKRELHQNLVLLNPQYDSLTLFKKSQKLLDRFLFLFFAEDRQLLPPNSVRLILNDWRDLQDRDVEVPLYDRFKKYFEYLNTGYKGKRYDVFAYNGGLFKPDEILDTILIDDELLFRHTYKLSEYNFASEVDVNILGHIFENSLNELDELTREQTGKTKEHAPLTKRKKDGVFYTPKYITKYIVENTVGKLCTEKKDELQLIEEEYTTDKKRQLKTKQALLDKLKTYQSWLLQLTICDPACGSGAFLNQALDFLMKEHSYIDELQAKLLGVPLIFSDYEKSILENNLFGVDLNEESVEIAKLSLWLRTAQPNRKLNDLNSNIKCGNSLIDDPAVAGDKAFNWHEEFPTIFKKKEKKIWHVTTATHNSRYSQRMFDNFVKMGEPVWLSEQEELIVTETISEIVKTDGLNIVAYNICGDHAHIIVVGAEEEIPKIVQKLKAMSARACNIAMGRTVPTEEHAPLHHDTTTSSTTEHAPLHYGTVHSTGEHAPLHRGQTQHHLWASKFDQKEITTNEQYDNTIAYIQNNRKKHNLPESKALKTLISQFTCSKAHAMRKEYTGGFDVVIGNPPYVNANDLKKNISISEYNFLKINFDTAKGTVDLYIYFFEKGLKIIKKGGFLSYITPNRFLSASYGKAVREFILSKYQLVSLIDYSDKKVFEDASTYPVISFIRNKLIDNYNVITGKFDEETKSLISKEFSSDKLNILAESILGFLLNDKLEISEKIINQSLPLINCGSINATSTAGEADEYSSLINEIEGYKLINTGTIDPYFSFWGIAKMTDKGVQYKTPYLPSNDERISKNRHELYSSPKIIISKIGLKCEAFYDNTGSYASINTNCIHSFSVNYLPEYVLCWINSKLYNYLFECFFDGLRMAGGYLLYSSPNLRNTYIKPLGIADQQPFIEKADQMLSLNKQLQETTQKFQRTIQRKFNLEELSGKLNDWYLLSYSDFIKELGKKKVKLSLSDEAEWEDYFLQEQKKALDIKHQIDTTDKEIDLMVYALYGLTEEEIAIVENSNQ